MQSATCVCTGGGGFPRCAGQLWLLEQLLPQLATAATALSSPLQAVPGVAVSRWSPTSCQPRHSSPTPLAPCLPHWIHLRRPPPSFLLPLLAASALQLLTERHLAGGLARRPWGRLGMGVVLPGRVGLWIAWPSCGCVRVCVQACHVYWWWRPASHALAPLVAMGVGVPSEASPQQEKCAAQFMHRLWSSSASCHTSGCMSCTTSGSPLHTCTPARGMLPAAGGGTLAARFWCVDTDGWVWQAGSRHAPAVHVAGGMAGCAAGQVAHNTRVRVWRRWRNGVCGEGARRSGCA